MYSEALSYLHKMLGSEASFREGQWQAIDAVVNKKQRLLLVQRTGWGKSLVYFMATRLLRDRGKGPCLLISPLLALMRNQIQMAEKIGVRAATINSANVSDWQEVESRLVRDEIDILLISPERLNSERFLNHTLPSMQQRLGLFVVDEVHCISDWGHDFRPDYQRIVRIVRLLPENMPVIGVTATANDRVVEDVAEQLGSNLRVMRGPLMRKGLRLRNIVLKDQAERLAWLAENLPKFPGSGIIYTLTVADSNRVERWLQQRGIDVRAYNSDLPNEERVATEEALLNNQVKALSATVALGMGFDKPDLYFVIHFQRPGNVVSYYQQVGRAGRALKASAGILLAGYEDDEIQEYFIDSAFPPPEVMEAVLNALEKSNGLKISGLQKHINCSFSTLEKALKLLSIDGAVTKEKAVYHRTLNPWQANAARYEAVTQARRQELVKMQEYVHSKDCLMQFLARELSDPYAEKCGRCGNCSTPTLPDTVTDHELVRKAVAFLQGEFQVIPPRKLWPVGLQIGEKRVIAAELLNREGRALSIYGDAGWGRLVALGKYRDHYFSDELVTASARLIREIWQPEPFPRFLTAIPSLRAKSLVTNFAERLAALLSIPFVQTVEKTKDTRPQKEMANSAQQVANIIDAFKIKAIVPEGPCLLVDDIFDSRWTLTVAGFLIAQHGGGPVYSFTLAKASDRRVLGE